MIIKLFNEMHVKLGTYMLLYIYVRGKNKTDIK